MNGGKEWELNYVTSIFESCFSIFVICEDQRIYVTEYIFQMSDYSACP